MLTELLRGVTPELTGRRPTDDVEITGLTSDSRRVAPGYLFAAFPGSHLDGRRFVEDAMRRGAAAVLGPPGTALGKHGPAPLLIGDNPRRLFARMAAGFYGAQPKTVVAVTGTNGKTSVVWMLRQIWERLGLAAAGMGTLGISAGGVEIDGNLTTPDPVGLHENLRTLAERGIAHLALEASSHGLHQCRLDGVDVAATAFTNLTRDHLDYHGTMDAYLGAKLRLFTEIASPGAAAVLNANSAFFEAVETACRTRGLAVTTYGEGAGDIRLDGATAAGNGQRLTVCVKGRSYDVDFPLVGAFQVSNALCALGLAIACGADRDAAVEALTALEGAPGRVQMVDRHPSGAPVFVDYAHTADALGAVLRALRPHTARRLSVVIGCGGDRDPGKRPEMGRTASALADRVVVTDDNPRSEDPAAIRKEILVGCRGGTEIGDRGCAIATAISQLEHGDVLVIAGKGHERGQIVGDQVHPFDDADVVREAIAGVGR
ncbi:MAG: UDP-N-acetylmuramoyl-L-alanyl-D-glutamate--2,6-diaminopimelate ligase [Rhodospirillales bacterium]|nr:UDP-N-acetylmuramoyl-L-alanyl-D-glutamate--2,6-diaminopimelate ligase [Rhodospirillales bacterium]